jgi:RimJ/RimL family protein N-acetyltransferase
MALAPIQTDRLLLRPARPSDAQHLASRRSDPEVAEYQNWTTPFPLDRAERSIAEVMELDGPTPDEWWMLTVADPADTEVFGDLVVHLSADGHTAEIGYTLARHAWGRGIAVEAATALVADLFDATQVTRVEGRLHPDNVASAMVLERIGMIFEGHTRLSYWLGDDNSDDWIYGMVRADWERWRDRPRGTPGAVELTEVTHDILRDVLHLATHRSQQRFVSPVATSLAQALVPPVEDGVTLEPWYRAVRADGELVGFVMLARAGAGTPEPYLWRLLIDRLHQRRGIGAAVIRLVGDQCQEWGHSSVLTSWVPGKGSPAPMYRSLGFEPTGRLVDGEVEARLDLD